MLFSNALLFAIVGATVSASVEVELPENWVAVEKREQAAPVNKLFARLAKRHANPSDTSKIPSGSTYTYVDPSTTITVTGGVNPKTTSTVTPTTTVQPTTTITVVPGSTSTDNGDRGTTTVVIATSCNDAGACMTTTFSVAY